MAFSTSRKFKPTARILSCAIVGATAEPFAVSAWGTQRSPVSEPRAGMFSRRAPVYFTTERASLRVTKRGMWDLLVDLANELRKRTENMDGKKEAVCLRAYLLVRRYRYPVPWYVSVRVREGANGRFVSQMHKPRPLGTISAGRKNNRQT